MRSQEFTGKTTQEAIDNGLAALGVTIADVHVDVIQEGAKGLFGLFGSKPACVRLTVMEEEHDDDHGLSDLLGSFSLNEQKQPKKTAPKPEKKPEPKAEKPAAPKTEAKEEKPAAPKAEAKAEKPVAPKAEVKAEKPAAPKAEVKPEARDEKPEAEAEKPAAPKAPKQPREKKAPRAPKQPREAKPETEENAESVKEYAPMTPAEPFNPTEPPVLFPEDTAAGSAQRFLMDVTKLMGVTVEVYVKDKEGDGLYIHMIGDTLGILIGRRGETLDALQYLTSLHVNKGRDGYTRVTLDTENYRAKREDSLRRLAQRMANRAQKTGRKVVLEPMNPYERRVLHTALQNHPVVTTHSEGEEPNRRVVIVPNGVQDKPERAERSPKGEGERAPREGGKPHRRRSHRGGRRGPKPEANTNETISTEQTAAPMENTGAEE